MPRMYKRTFRMYSIQNYQKEIEDLNAVLALVYSEKTEFRRRSPCGSPKGSTVFPCLIFLVVK